MIDNYAYSLCRGDEQYIDWTSSPIKHAHNLDDKSDRRFQDMEYELNRSKADWCKTGLGIYTNNETTSGGSTTALALTEWCKASDHQNKFECAAISSSNDCAADKKCHWGGCASAQQIALSSYQGLTFGPEDGTWCDEATASFCLYGQKPRICPDGKKWNAQDDWKAYYIDNGSYTWTCEDVDTDQPEQDMKTQRCACEPGQTVVAEKCSDLPSTVRTGTDINPVISGTPEREETNLHS